MKKYIAVFVNTGVMEEYLDDYLALDNKYTFIAVWI